MGSRGERGGGGGVEGREGEVEKVNTFAHIAFLNGEYPILASTAHGREEWIESRPLEIVFGVLCCRFVPFLI